MAKTSSDEPPMLKVMPFSRFQPSLHRFDAPSTATYWTFPNSARHTPSASPTKGRKRTFIMATLNVTPDSFSDGGKHTSLSTGLSYVEDALLNGASIIDIGGYSTRPGAAFVATEDEISRVVPVIEAIRASDKGVVRDALISVDTFRWEVAQAAILAGANVINDVYAFSGPLYPPTPESADNYGKMKAVAKAYSVPVIMMHSRGDAGSNKDYSSFASIDNGTQKAYPPVLRAIKTELGAKVDRAVQGAGGLRRWQIIVDPGVGFSKTESDNLAILRHCHQLVEAEPQAGYDNPLAGYPIIIGASRKSFLEAILLCDINNTGVQAERSATTRAADERDFATAAAMTCAVQQGVDILRVHNVRAMGDAIQIAEALWF